MGVVSQLVPHPRVDCQGCVTAIQGERLQSRMSAYINPRPVIQFGVYWWYRHVCAVGGVFNILTMLAANLVGFVIGTDGISYMISALTDSWEGAYDTCGGVSRTGLTSPNSFLHRSPIRAIYLFLSVRWRTDHVRV